MNESIKSHREAVATIVGAEVQRNEQGRAVGFLLVVELTERVSIQKVIPRKAGGLFDYEAYNAYDCNEFMDEICRATGVHPYTDAPSLPGKQMVVGLDKDGSIVGFRYFLPSGKLKTTLTRTPSAPQGAA